MHTAKTSKDLTSKEEGDVHLTRTLSDSSRYNFKTERHRFQDHVSVSSILKTKKLACHAGYTKQKIVQSKLNKDIKKTDKSGLYYEGRINKKCGVFGTN